MNKEELFLKYLDDQLTAEEKSEVELMLAENDLDKHLFEKVKANKENVLNELDLMNPKKSIEIPTFINPNPNSSTKKIFEIKLWQYAAIAAVLIGIYFGLSQLQIPKETAVEIILSEESQISKTKYKELDCYISPNRCWKQKQLAWTFIKINH